MEEISPEIDPDTKEPNFLLLYRQQLFIQRELLFKIPLLHKGTP
jgi:hypothetical protein